VCRPKHVQQLRNTGIINSTTRLHLVGSFYEFYITMNGSMNIKFRNRQLQIPEIHTLQTNHYLQPTGNLWNLHCFHQAHDMHLVHLDQSMLCIPTEYQMQTVSRSSSVSHFVVFSCTQHSHNNISHFNHRQISTK